jgi:aminocarboxymuconate-semialdehyde decarboxylase
MTIDAFPHIFPRPVYERYLAAATDGPALHFLKGIGGRPALAPLWDLDARFRQMDAVEGEYVQVLTMILPPVEQVVGGTVGADLARMANDHLAELVRTYPDRFVGFAAALCLDDVDTALVELDRAVGQLGALGVQIFTNANGRPMDDPRFEPFFARMAALDKPIWVHGARMSSTPDFPGEADSRYGMWLALGWPYEMGLFTARMVATGIFDRHPNLRLLTHHSGGMTPTFARRVSGAHFDLGPPGHEDELAAFQRLRRPPSEYFGLFYTDTSGQSPTAIKAALDFFGADRVLLGSDAPFGQLAGHVKLVSGLVADADRERVLGGNARRVLGIGSKGAAQDG